MTSFESSPPESDTQLLSDHPMTNDHKKLGWTEVKNKYNSCVLEQMASCATRLVWRVPSVIGFTSSMDMG